MKSSKLVGLNTKFYRHEKKLTQEKFSELADFKISYVSSIESGTKEVSTGTIDTIAEVFKIPSKLLLEEETALKAKKLPTRIDGRF